MLIRTKANSRGLRDIRTRSGRVDRVGIPYMAYMNISCLEMEKARREKERLSALGRITSIDKRLREIEAEKDLLLKKLGERTQDAPLKTTNFKNVAIQGKSGFRLKY
ncbi:MAG: hypothetical protein ACLP5H_26905 [Desulfomonilaceae bacterium]